jgi:hypothetical protein
MKTSNKYKYSKIIQQNCGQGYEDVSSYKANSQGVTTEMSGVYKTNIKTGRSIELSLLKHDLKEYQMLGYQTKVIFRKELKK